MGAPLRVCRYCGLEAKTKEELNWFVKRSNTKYGYLNFCKKCKRDFYRYKASKEKSPHQFHLDWNHFYKNTFAPLRKCTICGLEAYSDKDLKNFATHKKAKHGKMNRCKKCQNVIVGEQIRIKHKNDSFLAKFRSLHTVVQRGNKRFVSNLKWPYMRDLAEKQNYRCALTGIPLKRKNIDGKRHHNAPSIDRIDNNLGYEEGNVRWTSQWANLARNDYGDKVFYDMCKKTTGFNEKT